MRTLRQAGAGVFILMCLAGAARADEMDTVQAWLEKTFHAAHTLSYDGTFVYSHGDQLDAMRVVHAARADGERERLVSLSGPAREVLRDDSLVTCILPDDRSVVVGKTRGARQFPPRFSVDVHKLADHYDFAMSGTERIAGQAARKLLITPRDRYRYGYRLWLEQDSGLLLKSELLDEDGRPVEQFMFTDIRFLDDVPDALLKPAISGKEYTWYQPRAQYPQAPQDSGHWEADALPGGFSLVLRRTDSMPTAREPVEHLVFSDGLSSVSVFIEPVSDSRHNLQGSSRMGAVNAFGRVVDGHHITVMGEVPEATVRRIGNSMAHRGG